MAETIDVDYGAGRVVYTVDSTDAFTKATSDVVDNRGANVYGYLKDLENAADQAAADALTYINKLSEFTANVTPVTFDVPDGPNGGTGSKPTIPTLTLTSPTVSAANLDTGFTTSSADAVSKSWSTPVPVSFVAPSAPVATPDAVQPTAPSAYTMPAVQAPTPSTAVFVPDALPQPDLEDITLATSDIVAIDPLVIDVDTAGLIAAIEAMQSLDFTPPVLPEYLNLIPEIFTVVGSMATGNTIVNYQQILDNRFGLLSGTAPSTYNAFARRGLAAPANAAVYDTWLDGVLNSKMNDSDTVFEAIAVDDCITSAFKLGTAAHRMLVDIEIALYDLDFELAKLVVNANLENAKSVVAIYRAQVLLLEQHIAQYNASAAYVSSLTQVFIANAQQAEIVGDLNMVTADMFAASESVKGVAADVFKSLVMGERAKLAQYKAVIDSFKGYVAQASASVASYSGAVALHSAEVAKISNSYDVYSTTARAKQYDNSARAATLSAKQSELKSYASEADSLAASASAKAVELQTSAAVRQANSIERSLLSDEEAARIRIKGAVYDETVSKFIASVAGNTPLLAGTSDAAASITRYVKTASEAVSRSAQLSQQGNIQLAKAYADAYDAAGRAGAAVSSGNLTRFRASASMSASDALDANDSYGISYSDGGSYDYSESERYSATLGA